MDIGFVVDDFKIGIFKYTIKVCRRMVKFVVFYYNVNLGLVLFLFGILIEKFIIEVIECGDLCKRYCIW